MSIPMALVRAIADGDHISLEELAEDDPLLPGFKMTKQKRTFGQFAECVAKYKDYQRPGGDNLFNKQLDHFLNECADFFSGVLPELQYRGANLSLC